MRWSALLAVATSLLAARALAHEGKHLVPPKLLSGPEAVYPEEAQRKRISGVVELEISVDAQGAVAEVHVRSGLGGGLTEAAVAAAREFRFEPATWHGKPVACLIKYHYRFELPPEPRPAGTSTVTAAATSTQAAPPPAAPPQVESPFEVTVRAKEASRAASDWTFELGVARTAPVAGGTGAEILRKVPGFFISQHSGEGKAHQIFLRGFDAVHGQDTEITAGGIPINEVSNVHAQGYADLHFVIPEAVRRLRVVEGAYDPRQGDFAVAGSLDFELGLSKRGLLARFTGGQHGLARTMVAWGPEDQPEETFVAAELARGDGFGPARAWTRGGAIGQALLSLSPSLELRLLATTYASRFDSAGVVREDDLESGKMSFFDSYNPQQGGASARHSALVEIRHRGDDSTAALSGYAVLRDLRLRQNFTGYLVSPQGDRIEQTHAATTVGGAGHYRRAFAGNRVAIEAGMSWRYDRIDQTQRRLRVVDNKPETPDGSAGQLQDAVDADLRITGLGLYGDLMVRPIRSLTLRAGLRGQGLAFNIFDQLANDGLGDRRDAFGYKLAPKASLRYTITRGLDAFASYGNGFRSPQALSLAQSERSPFTTVHSAEVGTRFSAGPAMRATFAAFYTYVGEDLVFDHVSGRTAFFGATSRTGGAVLLESEPFDWARLAFSATYARAVSEESDLQVPFVPPLVVRLDAEVNRQIGELFGERFGVFADTGVTLLGPRPLPFSETGDGVFLIEAGAGVEVGPASLSIEIFNLLDSRWHDGEFVFASRFDPSQPPSLVPAHHITAGRPFSAQATLTINY